MKPVSALIAFVAAIGAQPAWACRAPVPEAKFRTADVVVDGVAKCLNKIGECSLKVLHLRKGHLKPDARVRIFVDVVPPAEPHGSDGTIEIRCRKAFEPEASVNRGRFYLRKRTDGSLYAFVTPDLQETEN